MGYWICCRVSLVVFILVLGGCGGSSSQVPKTGASVSGKVTFNKIPLNVGQITMHGKDSGGKDFVHGADIQEDGSYKIENAPLGDVKISIFVPTPSGSKTNPIPPIPGEKVTPVSKVNLPSHYNNPATSKISFKVQRGEQNFDINLP